MIIFLSIFSILSLAVNIILVLYVKDMLKKFYFASEAASEIFSRFDAYKEHLKIIFRQELFYGDKQLKEVIDHTKDLIDFLKKYEGIYSFTQPELAEILALEDSEEDYPEVVEKTFVTRQNQGQKGQINN